MKALLTEKEAAKYLGYSSQALRTSRGVGKKLGGIEPPKHISIGSRTIRYRLIDLDQWIGDLAGSAAGVSCCGDHGQ